MALITNKVFTLVWLYVHVTRHIVVTHNSITIYPTLTFAYCARGRLQSEKLSQVFHSARGSQNRYIVRISYFLSKRKTAITYPARTGTHALTNRGAASRR